MLDRHEEYDRMAECEQKLWWYRALHERTVEAIRQRFGEQPVRILDAGCGTGGLMMYLREQGFPQVEGFDLSDSAVRYCADRGLQAQALNLKQMAQHYPAQSFDVIVSNDTVCYLDAAEREAFVNGGHALLRDGGLLIFNAPAHEVFAGVHDRAVGIGKRFRRGDVGVMNAAGRMTEVRSGYWPFLLSPLILLVRTWQRIGLATGLIREIRSDVSMPSPALNRLFLGLCRWEQRVLGLAPFGSSLFVVLQRR